MRKQALPRLFDARKMCHAETEVEAVEAVSALPRFVEGLAADSGEVSIKLRFFRDRSYRRRLSGTVSANVALRCHRCHGPIDTQLDTVFDYVMVFGGAKAPSEKELPAELDLIQLEAEQIAALDVIEDELIIATPYASYHDDKACAEKTGLNYAAPEAVAETVETETHRPFADLAAMLKDPQAKPD